MIDNYEELKFKIETIEPHPREAIVIYFNFDEVDVYEMQYIHKEVENKFPNNTIVCVPDKVSLEMWSKDELENYMSLISEIIEEL